jgi:hypothetical protein
MQVLQLLASPFGTSTQSIHSMDVECLHPDVTLELRALLVNLADAAAAAAAATEHPEHDSYA